MLRWWPLSVPTQANHGLQPPPRLAVTREAHASDGCFSSPGVLAIPGDAIVRTDEIRVTAMVALRPIVLANPCVSYRPPECGNRRSEIALLVGNGRAVVEIVVR